MRKSVRCVFIVLALTGVFLVSAGASISLYSIPSTAEDAMEYATAHVCSRGDALYWMYTEGMYNQRMGAVTDLGITEEEFRASVTDGRMRYGTVIFGCTFLGLLDPDDEYVMRVAEQIAEMTDGQSRYLRALMCLNFVQTAITYCRDSTTYGCSDFAACPRETLYLGRGDCEDSAILLVSIYLALGYDAVILDYPDHIAAGVRWNGQGDYLFCEPTTGPSSQFRYSLRQYGSDPVIYTPGTTPDLLFGLNDGIMAYRRFIRGCTGI